MESCPRGKANLEERDDVRGDRRRHPRPISTSGRSTCRTSQIGRLPIQLESERNARVMIRKYGYVVEPVF
jgi:hypothetical protein